jgi:hypothetical protein
MENPAASGKRHGFTSVLLASLSLYTAIALWLAWHPVAIPSDDALFFARALSRFSVLDFSPQFPGYPGFVALGRLAHLVSDDRLDALAATTLLIALALPPVAGLVAWRLTGNRWRALLAFLLTLACPLLPDLALSLLSDGSGILFLLVFLALLPETGNGECGFFRIFIAGAVLAWAGACRPSDAVMIVAAAIGASIAMPRVTKPLLLGAMAVAIPVTAVVFALEGTLYIREGLRFFIGNATLWGNTPFANAAYAHGNWLSAIAALPGGPLLVGIAVLSAVAALRRLRSSPMAAATAFALLGHALWIAAFQNPDHLRHLAPVMILGGLLLATIPVPRGRQVPVAVAILYAGAELYCLGRTVELHAGRLPPLAAAVAYLREEPHAAIATNDGVFTLRALLPRNHVYDMHYPADARLGLAMAKGPAYRLTTTHPPEAKITATFRGRFAGEKTLWLERE